MNILFASIKSINGNGSIKTRFFHINEFGYQDVTYELCEGIKKYNSNAYQIIETGEYSLVIPIEYKNGLADYSFGCGLTHYLQESEFLNLSNYIEEFSLETCKLVVFTPDDVKNILDSNDNDHNLGDKIYNYLYDHI